MDRDQKLREQVIYLLAEGGAHIGFHDAVDKLPADLRGAKPEGLPFTPWRLLEHMRLAQWDILEFSRNPKHQSPEWPKGYWPKGDSPPNHSSWDQSVARFIQDNQELQELVAAESTDLLAPIPHGQGQTILREALLTADHNAYHVGQLMVVRRLLGSMPS